MARTTKSSAAWDGVSLSLVRRPLAVILVPKRGLQTPQGHSR
jgi:hypothetical protein